MPTRRNSLITKFHQLNNRSIALCRLNIGGTTRGPSRLTFLETPKYSIKTSQNKFISSLEISCQGRTCSLIWIGISIWLVLKSWISSPRYSKRGIENIRLSKINNRVKNTAVKTSNGSKVGLKTTVRWSFNTKIIWG